MTEDRLPQVFYEVFGPDHQVACQIFQDYLLRDLPMGLGDAARNAVRQWRFLPATINGEPIDVYYTVTVRFTLRGN